MKAIFFDLDGTLADDGDSISNALAIMKWGFATTDENGEAEG
jgi:phosphoglycolate phosphatase-like HAD superfamily hydrolase